MTIEEMNNVLYKGKLNPTTMLRLQDNNFLPRLEDVSFEDSKTTRMRVNEWKAEFVGRFIAKHPRYYSIILKMTDLFGKRPEWSDFTKQNIEAVVDMFSDCAQSSARTYLAMIKAILKDASEEVELPYNRFSDKMSLKAVPSVNVYLNLNDLEKLESYRPENEKEQIVLAQFLIGCYTGARHSDILKMSVDNIVDGYLTYVSQKTKVQTTVEAKPILRTLLPLANRHSFVDSVFNNTIRDICRKVGINEKIQLFRKGRDEVGEKWEFVASHTARRSFATNLAEMNVPILQIAKRMGHTDIKTTMRYLVCSISKLEDKASKFFS